MQGHRPYQVWQYDKFILPPQPLSSIGVQQGQAATSAGTGGTPHKRQQTTMERYLAAVPHNKKIKIL